ncbi:MAG: Tn3 family transposase [Candidatus Thiodiazotropha endolucinida]
MYTKEINKGDKHFHDNPPVFKAADRKRFFYVEAHFKDLLSNYVRGNGNRVFIVVAYGYFKATGQFFKSARQVDLNYVAGRFGIDQTFKWKNYNKNTRDRHRDLILGALGYRAFTKSATRPLKQIIRNDARAQNNPDRCFLQVCEWLFEHKVEIPDYQTIVDTIQSIYKDHLDEQIAVVKKHLSLHDANLIDELFEKSRNTYDKMEAHRLTLLKKLKQSTKTNTIRENVAAFDILKPLYEIANPIVNHLDFNNDGLKRYALSVQRRQVFQIKRLKDSDRHLHALIYVVYQFQQLVDTLIDTFKAAVKSSVNKAEKLAKDEYYRQRKEQTGHTQQLVLDAVDLVSVIEKVEESLTNPIFSDSEKIETSLKLIGPKRLSIENILDHIKDVNEDLTKVSGQALEMKYLEEGARSLQLKCSDIVCRLSFDSESSNASLLRAINKYQLRMGKVDGTFPVGFMNSTEKGYVDSEEGFRKLLYRVIFYRHISESIQGGSLHISNSNQYRQLDHYLFSKDYFKKYQSRILRLADMEDYEDVDAVLDRLELTVDAQFKETNEHILENMNEYIKTDGLGGFHLTSERNTKAEALLDTTIDIPLFPENEYIRIAEAISTVNAASKFLDGFEHTTLRYRKPRPEDKFFIAGIMALGEHLSVPKLSKLSHEIELSILESTTNGYFTLDNLRRANNIIVKFVNKLPLSKVYIGDFGLQTSSDGQKWSVAYESLNANYSFKYGGRDLVISAYTFTDARGMFPYSQVISGAEKEAHYMVDGVLKNEVVQSEMHSTDTDGYTEALFGITDIVKLSFAPRIKKPGKRHLYSFKRPSHYKRKKYPILPKSKVDIALIRKHWDDILRLCASIKLGKVTASQIFKRLNSKSTKQNPLYDAIKAYGGITKTIYLLRYADDVEMRKAVHKQLNKGESGNKLDKSLAIGRIEYTQTLKEDQEIAETCKRLLKNVIVCWNFMYLSKKLSETRTDAEYALLLRKIKASSMHTWGHFVFHGEYDFSDNSLTDSQGFDLKRLMDPNLIKESQDDANDIR